MMSLLMPHSAHESVSSSNTALVMSSNFCSVEVVCKNIIYIITFIPIIILRTDNVEYDHMRNQMGAYY